MRIVLKSYKNLIDRTEYNRSSDEVDKLLYEYLKVLKQQGWIDAISEGGVMSPDRSTLFVVSRSPYNGQLLPLSENNASAYNAIVEKLLVEDFVQY